MFSIPKEKTEFICFNCPRTFLKQTGNFPASQSHLYKYNNSFLPICNHCVDDLFGHYREALGNDEDAIRRICSKYDIYFSKSCFEASRKISATQSRMRGYISKTNLTQYQGKTYDDTLDEEKTDTIDSLEDIKDPKNNRITQKTVKFWGTGFEPEDYMFLNDKYDEWTTRHECNTKAQESIFQKISLLELKITRATQKGDKLEGLVNSYNTLLGSANVKPVQNNDNTLSDQNTFGTLIQKWENERPIPEPEQEWKDVDGIKKYISVWFLGHLCKMMGVNNTYSREYEAESLKYTVDPPDYIEDSVAAEFDSLFGNGNDE